MNTIVQFVLEHGYAILFAALFAHQVGLPLPGPLFLIAGGALAASGRLSFTAVMLLAVVACVLADCLWFEAGRRRGDRVLHFIHQFARDPDYHDRRAKKMFARYGPPILVVSKFIPGLDAVAPPLAGTARTSAIRFLAFDTVGATLYAFIYAGLGQFFSDDLNRAVAYAGRAGTVLACVALVGLIIYAGWKQLQRRRLTRSLVAVTSPNPPPESRNSAAKPCTMIERLRNGK